ncbi:MAG: acylphosphatase [Gemmatimonadetes bacterium]|nr:acylphosphatase [Gemmatimonadota bacterium]
MAELSAEEVRLRIEGRVQGVGFRWFVRERARRWGLAGWVRNLPDGAVELVARGAPQSIEGLRGDVRRGPEGAWVTGVIDLSTATDEQYPEPFNILR